MIACEISPANFLPDECFKKNLTWWFHWRSYKLFRIRMNSISTINEDRHTLNDRNLLFYFSEITTQQKRYIVKIIWQTTSGRGEEMHHHRFFLLTLLFSSSSCIFFLFLLFVFVLHAFSMHVYIQNLNKGKMPMLFY